MEARGLLLRYSRIFQVYFLRVLIPLPRAGKQEAGMARVPGAERSLTGVKGEAEFL